MKKIQWKYGYYLLVGILIIGNILVFGKLLFQSSPQNRNNSYLPRIGEEFSEVRLPVFPKGSITIPVENKAITVLYFPTSDPISLSHIAYFRLLTRTTIGDQISFFVVNHEDYSDLRLLRNKVGSDLKIIDKGEEVCRLINRPRPPPRTVIVISNGIVIYEGQILFKYFYTQLFQSINKDLNKMASICVGNSISGKLINVGTNRTISFDDFTSKQVMILFSKYCVECGDIETYNKIASVSNNPPVIIFPSIYNNDEIKSLFSKQIIEHNTSYILDLNGTNIIADHFLTTHPVVLIFNDGIIEFVSDSKMSLDDILHEIVVNMTSIN